MRRDDLSAEDPAAKFLQEDSIDRAQAILDAHPELAATNVWIAAILGDEAALEHHLARGHDVLATGGPGDRDVLAYLCFSPFLRLDRARSASFVRAARLLLDHGAVPRFNGAIYGAAGVAHDAELTRLLLERGADPNDDETPYHAPEGYDNEAFEVLVESGKLDANSMTTMLHRKLDWHDAPAIAYLLDHGADPNFLSRWGRRSLHHALERCNAAAIFELLLARGADPRLPAKNGASAIAIAARMGRKDVLELFEARGFAIELASGDALLAACARGDETAARNLFTPALVAELEQSPDTIGALADAAGAGNTIAVRLMLDLGFDPARSRTSRGDSSNDTALHIAIWRGRLEVVNLLLERAAFLVELKNGRNETPLEWAVRAQHESYWPREHAQKIVELLRAVSG